MATAHCIISLWKLEGLKWCHVDVTPCNFSYWHVGTPESALILQLHKKPWKWLVESRCLGGMQFWTWYTKREHHQCGLTHMFSGIWQLLFDPFHNLPEGGSFEGISIPTGPHNLIPAKQRTSGYRRVCVHVCVVFVHLISLNSSNMSTILGMLV